MTASRLLYITQSQFMTAAETKEQLRYILRKCVRASEISHVQRRLASSSIYITIMSQIIIVMYIVIYDLLDCSVIHLSIKASEIT
jgi:hypothetical protein